MFGRSVGFFASDASPQLIFKVDASNPAGTGILPANHSLLSTWVDLSGVTGNAIQTDPGFKPSFELNIQNGLPGILWDANIGSQSMTVTSLSVEPRLTLFVVSRCIDNAQPLFMEQSVDINSHNGFYLYGDGVNAQIAKGGSFVNPAGSANWLGTSTALAMMTYDGSTISTWKNGSLFQTGSGTLTNSVTTDQFFIGSRGESVLFFWGYMFEIRIYRGALSVPQITTVSNELNSKWAIY